MAVLTPITSDQLLTLNSENQRSELFLAFTEHPPVIFRCVINQTFTTHDQVYELTYDTPTGDYTDVIPGMVAWIGSSAGKYDYGQVRVRKALTADKVFINEVSEVAWANDLHVTIVDEMGLFPKHLYIDENQEVFMDRDVAYTDQHEVFAPVPIMGCNAVIDVESYPVTVKFPGADRSWVIGSTIASHLWTATAGTLTNETTDDPTLTIASYPTNGLIRVAYTPTTAAGASFTGYRYVKVYDATHRPVEVFQLTNCQGDFSSGGFSFEVVLYTDVTRDDIRDRAPIVLFRKDYYGDDEISLGQLEGREIIEACGWVDGESIVYDPEAGTVSFSVQGPQFWMEKINAYPTGVRIANKATGSWTLIPGLTVDRGLWHFLHWRTTATAILDVTLTGDGRYASEVSSPQSSLWGQIVEMAGTSIFATGGFDQYGRLFISIDPQMTPVADRTAIPIIQDFQTDEWEGQIQIQRRIVSDVAQIYFSGIAVDISGKGKAYFSLSPGHMFRRYGSIMTVERILLTDQTHSNDLCGLLAGWKNNQYPKIQINLAQNNPMFTLFPPQYGHIDIAATDTERGIERSLDLVPRTITRVFDSESGVISTQITFEAATLPDLSTNGDVPGIIDSGDIVNPPIDDIIIPPVDIVILPPDDPNSSRPKTLVIAGSLGVFYTENADADDVADIEWFPMNEGLTEDQYENIVNMFLTPSGKIWIHCRYAAGDSIHYANGVGWPFQTLVTQAEISPSGSTIEALGYSPYESEKILFVAGLDSAFDAYVGDSSGYSQIDLGYQIYYRQVPGMWIVCTDGGNWYFFGSVGGVFSTPWLFIIDSGYTLLYSDSINTATGQDYAYRRAVPVGTSDVFFEWDGSGAGGYNKGSGYPAAPVLTRSTTINMRGSQPTAVSPTGTIIMAASDSTPYRSVDGGDTWESVADTMPVGLGVWESCRDDYRFIGAGGTAIKFTSDVGETFVGLEGNLTYIAPLIDIYFVRFIE